MSLYVAITTPTGLIAMYFCNDVNASPMLTIDTGFVINAYECLNGCFNPKMLLIDILHKEPCAAYAVCIYSICSIYLVLHMLYVTLLLKSVYSSLAYFSLCSWIKQNQECSLKGCGLKHWNLLLVVSYTCNEVVLGKNKKKPELFQ